MKKKQVKRKSCNSLEKYKAKRPVKYACLLVSAKTNKHIKRFLEQHMDLRDNFVETWNVYED